MSAENSGINKDINKKKRRRRNYDDIDKHVQKLEESSVTKISDTTKLGVAKDAKTLEEVDSDDMNDDELDRLMLLEEEKEKLTENANVENEDDDEGLDLSILEEEDASVTPKRRTRGKVVDYKKTAELLDKEKEKKLEAASNEDAKDQDEEEDDDEDDDEDDEDDADYVPGE